MVSGRVVIKNPTGLHLRPAGLFSQTAVGFDCSVKFEKGMTSGDAKSILSVLGACIEKGDELLITCDGKEEEKALETMIRLVESGLGE